MQSKVHGRTFDVRKLWASWASTSARPETLPPPIRMTRGETIVATMGQPSLC